MSSIPSTYPGIKAEFLRVVLGGEERGKGDGVGWEEEEDLGKEARGRRVVEKGVLVGW